MSNEEIQKTMEFILSQQAKNEKAIADLIGKQSELTDQQLKNENSIKFLVEQQANFVEQQANFQETLTRLEVEGEKDRKEIRNAIIGLTESVNELATQAEDDRQVIRETFSKLDTDIGRLVGIIENTRDFAEQVARMAVSSEQRLKKLEGRVDQLEGGRTNK
ncbi:MAG: hypothetical protein AB1489_21395 [Acidobacteriota bacterium]